MLKIFVSILIVLQTALALGDELNAETTSRFDRFVCDEGLKVLNKNYILTYGEYETLEEAMDNVNVLEKYLEYKMMLKKNIFFNHFRVGIIYDRLNKNYHLVDTYCYSQNHITSLASVSAYFENYKTIFDVNIIKVHTNYFDRTQNERKDYIESIYVGDKFSYK